MSMNIIRRIRAHALFAGLLVGLATGTGTALAKSIEKQNLFELMTYSESIVVGTVTEKTDGFHNGLPFTEITVAVGQSIKGNHGKEYTFRQFGLIEPKAMGNGRVSLMVTPAGWPSYTKGESVMLFLHAPASETGFQTTAGLDQGRFSIRGGRIANSLDNSSLFDRVSFGDKLTPNQRDLVNQSSGAYDAEEFIALVRTIVEERWIENGVMTHED
jgi:hypothetical protein